MLLHHLFIDTAKKNPRKLAFIDRATGRRLSYSQALVGAMLLAKRFKNINEQYLGIMLPTSAGCALAVIATLFNGKVPVMINYSTGAENNIRFTRRKCGFSSVITSRRLLKKIDCPEMDGMIFVEDLIDTISLGEKILTALKCKRSASYLKSQVAGGDVQDTAAILFTSGSEKDPKGVELSHRNIYFDVTASGKPMGISDEDTMMAVLPLFHVFGFSICLWLPIAHGMTTVTIANPLEAKNVVAAIREERPTLIVGTPFFIASYLKQSELGDFDSLRLIVSGADKTPDWLHDAMLARHGKYIHEGYGATETSPVIAVNPSNANRPGTVGKLLPGVQMKILDLNTNEEVPRGKEGKILVKGDMVMKGYFDDIEQTALHIQNGWYETGDMGYLDEDGYLHHRGRLKRFVKVGGEMVSLFAVDLALEHLLPAEVDYCSVEIPDAVKGAQIAVAMTQNIDIRNMREQLQKRLPAIAIPRHVFVFDELPKMGNGKADFRAVTEMVVALYSRGVLAQDVTTPEVKSSAEKQEELAEPA